MAKYTVDEIIDGLTTECNEQKYTINYLEKQEEKEYYIGVHRQTVDFFGTKY